MIPLSDDNPTRTRPYVVYAIIALNVLAYLVDISGSTGPYGGKLWSYSMIPRSVVCNEPETFTFAEPVKLADGRVLVDQLGRPLVRKVEIVHAGLTPQWLTIFTSMFLHAGLLHIGMNMLFLWIFGNNIEDVLGHAKFLVFYLVCGVLAALAHIASNVSSIVPTVGASGAIAGVLGAYLLLYPHARVNALIMLGFFWDVAAVPAVLLLGIWFVTQLIGLGGTGGQLGGGVAYWAHVGGFVAGALIILAMGGRKLTRRQRTGYVVQSRPYPWRPWR